MKKKVLLAGAIVLLLTCVSLSHAQINIPTTCTGSSTLALSCTGIFFEGNGMITFHSSKSRSYYSYGMTNVFYFNEDGTITSVIDYFTDGIMFGVYPIPQAYNHYEFNDPYWTVTYYLGYYGEKDPNNMYYKLKFKYNKMTGKANGSGEFHGGYFDAYFILKGRSLFGIQNVE